MAPSRRCNPVKDGTQSGSHWPFLGRHRLMRCASVPQVYPLHLGTDTPLHLEGISDTKNPDSQLHTQRAALVSRHSLGTLKPRAAVYKGLSTCHACTPTVAAGAASSMPLRTKAIIH